MQISALKELNVVDREVARRHVGGHPANVIMASRRFGIPTPELWDAITNPRRLCLWFGEVTGDLRLGGRYQIEDMDVGEITRCDRPSALALTWESQGQVSWLDLKLLQDPLGARLLLEHAIPDDDYWQEFGPGPMAVTWDLALLDLSRHLGSAGRSTTPEDWMESEEARMFISTCCKHWREAHIRSGADVPTANAMAQRTVSGYDCGPIQD